MPLAFYFLLPFISPYANLVKLTSSDLARQIANAQHSFNITVSLLLFPFVKQIAWVAKRLAPARPQDEKKKLTAFIDEMQFSVPAVALNEAARELVRLGETTVCMIEQSCQALI